MTRTRLAVLALLAVLGAAAASPTVARADEPDFLDSARQAEFDGDDDSLLRDGYLSCALSRQVGQNLTVRAISRAAGVTEDRATQFYELAQQHLC